MCYLAFGNYPTTLIDPIDQELVQIKLKKTEVSKKVSDLFEDARNYKIGSAHIKKWQRFCNLQIVRFCCFAIIAIYSIS